MKILSGVYEKDEGTIEFDGEIIEHTTPIQALRRGLSIIYQEFNLVNTMTVGENIFLGRFSENHGMKGTHQKARELLDSIGSKIDTYTLVGDLSASEMQMVEITKALSFDSKLIIMDEPFVGLDPKASHLLKTTMRELCESGTAIFFSTHVLEVAEKLCDKIAIIKDGKLIKSGTMDEVRGDASLEDVFLELEDVQ